MIRFVLICDINSGFVFLFCRQANLLVGGVLKKSTLLSTMSSPNGSFSSIDEFFGTTNAYGNADDKKPKDDQISISGAAKNSIKRKPAIHHPRITSNENCTFLSLATF